MDYKQKFIEYYQANIHREGADRLLELSLIHIYLQHDVRLQ